MIILKRNNTSIGLSFKLMDSSSKPIILDNCTVNFKLADMNNNLLVKRDATIVDINAGLINFFFYPSELNIYGQMQGEIELIYFDGNVETFPKSGTIPIMIMADL